MNLSLGIVGLPNVGKSTLFNTLTSNNIPAENYPFCTIDPNVGVVPVADNRINEIAKIVNPQDVVPAVVEFYDIAGIVKGAHKGEGLGNAFLANIRNVSAIVHVIRAFENDDITHVEERIDPAGDKEIIEMELILKDLESLNNQKNKLSKELRGDSKKQKFMDLLNKLIEHLENENLAISLELNTTDQDLIRFRRELFLLTDKKIIYLINGDWYKIDEQLIKDLRKKINIPDIYPVLPMNIKQEYEISQLDPAEQDEFRNELGLEFNGIADLTRASYSLLDLISFFTAGEKEVKAWTIKNGSTAPEAAGTIHTDFQTKFITSEVVAYNDFINCDGWHGVKDAGKVRLEGKEYIVKDGDVMLFKHGA
ncbi:redox-regulated ATPase YchF [Candidatus Dojkabacteria bacterium]|uniref:Ribosome-binding ATPase YchF n=1 Tax=Candidatus Dojkabacteria bacterium TaxID=2099670 RepID=A0A955L5L2_9BACT|nr:redox-regulated ATPase YchF [Candidatus Dojkabacteria bacterium]